MLTELFHDISSLFGYPTRLRRYLESNHSLFLTLPNKQSVSWSNVIKWNQWNIRDTALGWHFNSDGYRGFTPQIEEFEQLGSCQIIENWECEIQQLEGFGASKSNLDDFQNLDDMVEKNSQEMITPLTKEKLHQNLTHTEIRIGLTWNNFHQEDNQYDNFSLCLWDGRIFLQNTGGSHHLAAARYIASRLGEQVQLHGKLFIYGLNKEVVKRLLQKYEIFLLSFDDGNNYPDFIDEMGRFKATFIKKNMPLGLKGSVILLPKNEKRSLKVANIFHELGAFDLGHHLYQEACKNA